MTTPSFDITPFLDQDEGQHFERKSLFEGPERTKSRDRRDVRDDVAENVAAFANAEGGVLILGIENDDLTVTGHKLPKRAVDAILAVPCNRLIPPQPEGFVVTVGDHELIVFDVPMEDVPVRVDGDGFPAPHWRSDGSSQRKPNQRAQVQRDGRQLGKQAVVGYSSRLG